jgi:hypothetical protein
VLGLVGAYVVRGDHLGGRAVGGGFILRVDLG